MGVRKKQRLQWSERATWTLIKLWEDNLHSLRAQKHNGDVHASIAGALTSAGVPRTKEQVHTKIENFGHTYSLRRLRWQAATTTKTLFREAEAFQVNAWRKLRATTADFQGKMLEEQRLLREKFEAAHKAEIRNKSLKLHEKLVDAMVFFFNKTNPPL
ncbi:hypothetical protein HPB49_001364 [Dermacentor silvarum]|uniref:Uncharacterized protein n=1 Tax=Dermacentor silvarum TaxID=543639 RepID=A0ACB8CCS5_DERSI|nr:hypothetical protein HPB49_001364 [Dermacentor silvarum]